MKLKIIDSLHLFNDILYNLMLQNSDKFYTVDNRQLYIGKFINKADLYKDIAVFVSTMSKYISIHFLINPNPPKLNQQNLILDHSQMYKHMIAGIKKVAKLPNTPVTINIHEYTTEAKRAYIVKDLLDLIGDDNCEVYKLKHKQIIVNTFNML